MPSDLQRGLVVLAGAGPGDPGLLTRAAGDWLARAETVVYDRLANEELLALAPRDAERIYVGKAPGEHSWEQSRINELLIEKCRAGRIVVRLKGGDPLVFGRGGEEAAKLAAAGCAFRFVPGITAGAGGLAYAGIPLTDRRCASTACFVTGHEDPTKTESSIDWSSLAGVDTLVFYMGVRNLPQIAERLVRAGRDPTTPAAVVENATRPSQRVVTAALGDVAEAAREANVRPPALIIVGPVVALRDTLQWFEKLPLHGRTVLVTRSRSQASRLSQELRLLGGEAIEAPTIRIDPPDDFEALDAALRRLGEFDWLVLTSPNGVEHVCGRMSEIGLDARALSGAQVAAVGAATADALRKHFLKADLVPGSYTTESLAAELVERGVQGSRILLARADIATRELHDALQVAGAEVEEVVAYRTVPPDALPAEVTEALAERRVDWITFTSSSTVENFFALHESALPDDVKLAAIGPVTAATLRDCGHEPSVVAATYTIDGLIEAIFRAECCDG